MGILHDTTTLAALSLASCEDWTHDPWFTRPVLYHWAKEALYVHKDNKKITSTYENYGRKCREKKYYTASREDWTLDPWFTRPVLCHWAIEAFSVIQALIENSIYTKLRDQSLLRWRHWNHETSPLNVFHLWCFTKNHWTSQLNFWVIIHAKVGLDRDLNPGPRAPEARIIPLDHQAMIACSLTTRILFFFSLNILLISTFLNRCQKKRKKNC
jgi:hypothetical protein